MQLNAHEKEVVPFLVHSPPDVFTCLLVVVVLMTQTKKRQTKRMCVGKTMDGSEGGGR